MRQVNYNIIPVQSAATVTSSAIDSRNLFYMSAQVATTGGAAGTLKIQVSNDEMPITPIPGSGWTPTNWSDLSGASVAVSGAAAFLIPKTDCCYQYVRLVYTNSGTGTISVVFKALGS